MVSDTAAWAALLRVHAALVPVLDRILAEYEDELTGACVDVDAGHELVRRFGVESVPSVLLIKDGAEIFRMAGSHRGGDVVQPLANGTIAESDSPNVRLSSPNVRRACTTASA